MKAKIQFAQTDVQSLQQLPGMLAIAQAAIQLVNHEALLIVARADYHERIAEYESAHGRLAERLNPSNPRHADAIAFSAWHYAQYAGRKREVYNAKRRLQTAVRRAGKISV